jgi:multidrug efflux system membrane fusion protein
MNGKTASQKHVPFNQRLSFWIIILISVLLLSIYRYYVIYNQHNASSPIPPVVVAAVTTQNVPVYLSALGNVTATYTVTIKTQVNGQLIHVVFKEGQLVKAGDLLAQIDPRPYQALLIQYEGQLERDKALLANALVDLQRYQKLWQQDSVSQQTLATQQSLVQQYEGAIRNDEGLIQGVKVNLIYCRITSPIEGRIGLRLVDPGNFVQSSDTSGIAVINTLNPITVVFSLPEDNIPQLLPLIYGRNPVSIRAYNRQQSTLLAEGSLLTMDNQVDTTTGTVKLKAQFDNADYHLFPNQFVNIQILIDTLTNATIIPTAAIQHGASNDFVYRLNTNKTINAIPITTSVTTGDNTVITKGLVPGQLVVVEGADKLTDGIKVAIMDPSASTRSTKQISHLAFLRHFFT